MTQPESVEARHRAESAEEGQEGEAIEQGQGGEAEDVASGNIVAPQLADIQHSYEEARASIAGLARSSRHAEEDVTNPHPDTEEIDLRLAKPPVVEEEATPPTTAMSIAARHLAERPVVDGGCSPAMANGPTAEGHGGSGPREEAMPAPHRLTDPPAGVHMSRRWWHAIRTTLPGAPGALGRPTL